MPGPSETQPARVPRSGGPRWSTSPGRRGRAAHGIAGRQRGATVGETFAERVRQAIATLDYQPDERARQLRSGITGTVGAAVRNISDHHPVLGAAEAAARAAGLTIVAMSTEDDEQREREAVMSMCRRRMDGIILEPIADNHQYLQPEIDSGLTVVAFDRPATGVIVDTVLTDNRGGISQAFRHLVGQGHRRIGYIGDDERIYTGHERAAAFRDCLRAQGGPVGRPGASRADRARAARRRAWPPCWRRRPGHRDRHRQRRP